MLHNVNCGSESDVRTADDFNPFALEEAAAREPAAEGFTVPITVLKQVFVDNL